MTKLQKRIASALVLICLAVAATWLGGWSFVALVTAVAAIMTWEWGRLVRSEAFDAAGALHAATVVAAIGLFQTVGAQAALLMIAAAVIVSLWIATPSVLSSAGIAYVACAAVALIWMRETDGLGFTAVLFLFVCVWTTDTFAMVVGKLVGGPQLFPSISPNKTWAGAAGGLMAAMLVGALLAEFLAPEVWPIAGAGPWFYGLMAGAMLSLAAQLGDLGESWIKRVCNVKDTSELIPGHGGVLDRMDGIVGAVLFVGALAVLISLGGGALDHYWLL